MRAAATPGVCRHCACTDKNACRIPPSGEPCSWIDATRTVCSRPSCIIAERKRLRAIWREQKMREGLRRGRFRGKGHAA